MKLITKFLFVFILLFIFSYLELNLKLYSTDILWGIRVPRLIAVILTGFSLSTAGFLLQYVTRNPLADPFIIGTSGGSMLGLIICEFLGLNYYSPIFFVIINIFALFFTLLAYRISKIFSKSNDTMLLSGIAVNSFVISLIVLFVIFSRENTLYFFHLNFGSFNYINQTKLLYSFLLVILSLTFIFLYTRVIEIISFSEEKAITLGIDVEKIKFFMFILISVLTSTSVVIAGIIAFVGLMVPHISYSLFRGVKTLMFIVLNGLLGSLILLISDVVARYSVYPLEIPPGVITSIFGSLFFIYLVIRRKRIIQ